MYDDRDPLANLVAMALTGYDIIRNLALDPDLSKDPSLREALELASFKMQDALAACDAFEERLADKNCCDYCDEARSATLKAKALAEQKGNA